ncbi:HD domain-containing phosphohydrolase [Rubrivivax sp. A210]|uniref:HD domain-containing phosphohydrolase n=1 Tax=Rubrivivax sp. A210 TaxID=2772301 RepID=UPI001F3E4BC2|nr:HD domain-containing phosphohydrolase [Rubrivivax sp. A210]
MLDDEPASLRLLADLLSPHYNVHPFVNGRALLRYVSEGRPVDLVMLDVVMPPPDGYQVCTALRRLPQMEEVPVIFISALESPEDEAKGLALGAVDFVRKPFSAPIVLSRVGHHVRLGRAMRLVMNQNELLDQRVAARTAELAAKNKSLRQALNEITRTQDATIVALSSLAEARDNETGQHIVRTQRYVRALAEAVKGGSGHVGELDGDAVEMLGKSAALHDIGKVAIPDHILLKPGRLTPEEFEIMKTHAEHGRKAIELAESRLGNGSNFLRWAREIAYGHHERWDGQGYPQGLAGAQIPLSARLMAVADVYDALISQRVYKEAMPHAAAVAMILAQRGKQFDPNVVDAFETIADRFADIARELKDPH